LDNNRGEQGGKHSGPVWEVQWVEKSREERTELLYSISSDGKIVEWSMKKGLEHTGREKLAFQEIF